MGAPDDANKFLDNFKSFREHLSRLRRGTSASNESRPAGQGGRQRLPPLEEFRIFAPTAPVIGSNSTSRHFAYGLPEGCENFDHAELAQFAAQVTIPLESAFIVAAPSAAIVWVEVNPLGPSHTRLGDDDSVLAHCLDHAREFDAERAHKAAAGAYSGHSTAPPIPVLLGGHRALHHTFESSVPGENWQRHVSAMPVRMAEINTIRHRRLFSFHLECPAENYDRALAKFHNAAAHWTWTISA